MNNKLFIILAFFALTNCSDEKTADNKSDIHNNSVDTINYLDFNFSKVIAFATVNPFDPNDLYGKKTMDVSKFGDTVSRTLNSSQTKYLADILSGKLNKDTLPDPADCHNPRHNIAFLDNKDSVVNFISVCFECSTMRNSKPQNASFKNFEDFFNSIGLKVFDQPDQHKQYYDSINRLRPHRKTIHLKDTVKFTPTTEKTGK